MDARLSTDDAVRFVKERYGERASTPHLLGAGEWSRAYAFSLDDREAVIRFGGYGEDFAKDAVVSRLRPRGVPVPEVLEFGETGRGGYFVVSERRYGRFLDALDGAELRSALPSLLSVLDGVAVVELSDTAGYGGWSSERRGQYAGWMAALLAIDDDRPRLGDWRTALEISPVGIASFRLGLAALRELAPALPDVRRLIHADLLNRNVLVSGGKISAVFDWGNSMYGDALYDAAWLLYWWPWYPAWREIDIRAELVRHWRDRAAVPADLESRLLAYQLHIGLDHLAYTAATQRWADLLRNDRQVRDLVRGDPPSA